MNQFDACCPASCSAPCKKSWLACSAQNLCDAPGAPPSSCPITETAVLDDCYDASGNVYASIYTGTTAEGCGPTFEDARFNAGLSLAKIMCLTDEDEEKPGCCLYHFAR